MVADRFMGTGREYKSNALNVEPLFKTRPVIIMWPLFAVLVLYNSRLLEYRRSSRRGIRPSSECVNRYKRSGWFSVFSEFLSQNLLWVGAFVIVANLWIWSLLQSNVKGVGSVSALGMPALQRNGKSVIIDVSDEAQYKASHLPDAKNFPVNSLNEENSDLMKHREKTVILVCATGSKSNNAARKLKSIGFNNLHVLRGGMMSWNKENLPTSTS
jgi:rhodanese-related sulfurtransferase